MIKTIIFDFGNVLANDADAFDSTYKSIASLLKIDVETINQTWNKHWPAMGIGQESFLEFFKELLSQSQTNTTLTQIVDIYKNNIQINDQAIELVKELKAKGYRLLLLSNDTKEGTKWRLDKVKKYFSKNYSSAIMGLKKPDPKAFEYVLAKEKIKPEETLFIDDRERNIEAAKNLGFQIILFKNLDQLKKDLSSA